MQYTLFSILAVLLGLSKPEVSAMKTRPCHRLDVVPRFSLNGLTSRLLALAGLAPFFLAESKKQQLYVSFGANIGTRLFEGYV